MAFAARTVDQFAALADVIFAGLAQGDLLYYDGTRWANKVPGAAVDGSGNLVFVAQASGQPASVTTGGADTDVTLKIRPKGTGCTQLGPDSRSSTFFNLINGQRDLEVYRASSTKPASYGVYADTVAADLVNAFSVGVNGRADTTGAGATQNLGSTNGVIGAGFSSLPSGRTITAVRGGNFSATVLGGGTAAEAYGVFQQVQVTTGSTITTAIGNAVWFYNITQVSGTGTLYGYYIKNNGLTTPIATFAGLWMGDMSSGIATNPYFLWCDSPGVFRVKADGVMAHYNPAFSPKYTPGATQYERIVIQWNGNAAEVTTEKGADGGTLRPLKLGGSGVYVTSSAPAAAPTDGNLANGQISFYLDESGNNLKVRVRYSDGTLKTGTLAVLA
jgi:hypothetical protein